VTVHHLLTHTGGTGDYFSPEWVRRLPELRTVGDYLELFGDRDPAFEPGAWFDYSNYGYVLLGAIVEAVTGDYYAYVDEAVHAPAGMTRSGALPEEQVPDLAVGYTEGERLYPHYRGTPAGAGYSTAGDLWRFARALLEHRLLDEEHTALWTTGKVNMGWNGRCAYGFHERTVWGVRSIGGAGGAPGMSTDLTIYPDSGWIVVVTANTDPPIAQQISGYLCDRLPITP
jgi:CubicO group peptidase (beta-lactamase class C family)